MQHRADGPPSPYYWRPKDGKGAGGGRRTVTWGSWVLRSYTSLPYISSIRLIIKPGHRGELNPASRTDMDL